MDDTTMVRVAERVADLEEDFDASFQALERAAGSSFQPIAERQSLRASS
jgi:hypothetical protein